MHLSLSAPDLAFRDEVRAFLTHRSHRNCARWPAWPPRLFRSKHSLVWQRILHEKGLGGAQLAGGIWRHGLERHAPLHLLASAPAPARRAWRPWVCAWWGLPSMR